MGDGMGRWWQTAAALLVGGLAGAWIGSRNAERSPVPAAPAAPIAVDTTLPAGVGAGAASLFNFPFSVLENQSAPGRAAAMAMARTIGGEGLGGCHAARDTWAELSTRENFGGEYGALDWLCAWLGEDEAGRAELGRDAEGARLLRYLQAVGWSELLGYLENRYRFDYAAQVRGTPLLPMGTVATAAPPRRLPASLWPRDRLIFVHELLRFDGPGRAGWERTDEVLAKLALAPDAQVADVGAGRGFYTMRFARVVPRGKVYAVDIDNSNLDYLDALLRVEGVSNVATVRSRADDIGVAEASVDLVFVCNLYHAIYGISSVAEREGMLASIKRALKPGGRLVISDNLPADQTPPGTLPYSGYTISPGLIVAQLEGHGFVLQDTFAVVPQRYELVFTAG